MDYGPGKVAAVNPDQKTGKMTLAWSIDERTTEWTDPIGPPNHRVLVGTNIKTNVTNPLELFAGPIGANYKEQLQWRDAATGKLLAAPDFFNQMIVEFQMWPGFGGLIYYGENDGHIIALKVLPSSQTGLNSTTSTKAS
jgi:hypothetical protein